MRTIITGGTGLIGRQLADLLAHDGYDVVVLSRSPENQTMPHGIRLMRWDARTAEGWAHLLDHPDVVIINLAGENPANSHWTSQHKARVLQSRLDAAEAINDAIQQADHKPVALMQASAVGYYGSQGDTPLTEDTSPGDNWRAQVCVQWEAAASYPGVRTCYLRIGIVLDVHGGALPPFLLAGSLFGSRIGHGGQWIPWIHNEDVATAIKFLIKHDDLEGPFNLVAPNPTTNSDFMTTVAQLRGRFALVPVPAVALKMVMGEMASTVLDSQRVYPERLQNAGFRFQYPHLEDALRDIMGHRRSRTS